MAENRRAPRQKSFLRALVYFNNSTTPVECLVRDISETGARLKLPNQQRHDGTLDLYIPINGKKFKGVIRRQYGDEIGIAFGTDPASSANRSPLSKEASSIPAAHQGKSTAAVPVLVVDDSPTVTRLIGDFLRKLGFTDVDVAHDGHAAVAHLQKKQYGLILSDWEMAPMSGEEFLKRKRLDRHNGNTPVIMISAAASRGSSWLAGASAHLAKPFGERDLQAAIDRAFFLSSSQAR